MNKQKTLKQLIHILNAHAPESAAEGWDNVGLLVGDLSVKKIQQVVVSTDLTLSVFQKAAAKPGSLIVVHHPVIFPKSKGLSRVSPVEGRPQALPSLIYDCVKKSIPIYVMHTNFDRCALEVPDAVSSAIGINPVGRLFDESEVLMKLSVFVPESHIIPVRAALGDAGAGRLGDYDHCAFQTAGEGSFRPLPGSNAFLGKIGKIEFVNEARLEMVFPKAIQDQIFTALRASHPYEEIAYDLLELKQKPKNNGLVQGQGYGVYGDLKRPVSLSVLLSRVKKGFQVPQALVSQSEGRARTIKRVAYTPGAGKSFMASVIKSGCDAWVTGELGYHAAAELARAGITAIELGHPQSEFFFAPTIQKWLKAEGVPALIMRSPWPKFT